MSDTVTHILVPVDFSASSRAALWRAGELAGALGATIDILHVIDLPKPHHMAAEGYVPLPVEYRDEMRRLAEQRLADWLASSSLAAVGRRELAEGKPAAEIVSYARDRSIDLIVMGTHGRGAISQMLLGSVADKVIRTAPCPVLTIRAVEAAAA
jgi:nucleotide-binding universal stress UspA family protein